MTLVELLVSIAILFLIIAPLTLVLQFALATVSAAQQRTTDSAGAQLLSSYLVSDVQSAAFAWSPSDPAPFTTAPFTKRCGGAETRLELQSEDATSGAVLAVTYDAMSTGSGTPDAPALVRRLWSVAATGCTAGEQTVLVRDVGTAALPAATCLPTCAAVQTVRLKVTALSRTVHNSSLYSSYTFNLTATRRSA